MRAALRRIADFGRNRKACLYYAACVVLLVAAAGLRFHELSGDSVWADEAVASSNSSGALSEVVPNTRNKNSSPILYPLVLWAVQKVDVSAFSIRVLPATAGVLTVAVMLFLLPGLGVARGAAFLAALLSTLSVQAIRHAQDAREYSIDALLAVLLIAGLLWYLRDGRKALLCVSLFLAPLLQYGLVLFGAAVMGAAIVLPPPSILAAPEGNSYLSRLRNWFKPRIALVRPAGCFLAGCAISYAVTLRYQWHGDLSFGPDGYLSAYYYQGEFDAHSIFEFSIYGIWSLLTFHLPEAVAIAALTAGALLLVAALLGKFQGKFPDRAVAVLFSLCLAISVGAAVLGIYPLGGTRHVIYLGPIVFLAVGVAFHGGVGGLAGPTRRGWPAPALVAAAAVAIALAGMDAMRQDNPYETKQNIKSVLAFLEERVREDDLVYVGQWAVPDLRFYQEKRERPDNYYSNYYYGNHLCGLSSKPCRRELTDLLVLLSPDLPNRIFLVHQRGSMESIEGWDLMGEHFSVERFLADGDGKFNISLITNVKESIEAALRSGYEAVLSGEPAVHVDFDIYINDNTLTYVKEPCAPADTEARFLLHLHPVDANDLPDRRRQYGFDNLDFDFDERGVIFDGKCMTRVPLPEYDITRIVTGQYVVRRVLGGFKRFWEVEMRLDDGVAVIVNAKESKKSFEAALRSDYETLVAGEPVMRSDFDVYLSEDTLTYVKEPCSRADTEATFFLHLHPVDGNDLSDRRRQYGFDNRDFDFDERGVISDGKCMARIPLPGYAIAGIGTGQYVPAEGGFKHLWEEEIRLDE